MTDELAAVKRKFNQIVITICLAVIAILVNVSMFGPVSDRSNALYGMTVTGVVCVLYMLDNLLRVRLYENSHQDKERLQVTKTWFTSDTHFFHDNVIKHCQRPFADSDEMNGKLVTRWNAVVQENDLVYHLGDVCFGARSRDKDKVIRLLNELNGRIVLVRGNHDSEAVQKCGRFEAVMDLINLSFSAPDIGVSKTNVVLSHYPMAAWNGSHHGSLNLHGHCHGLYPGNDQQTDVGVDLWDFEPVSFQRIVERLRTLPAFTGRGKSGPRWTDSVPLSEYR